MAWFREVLVSVIKGLKIELTLIVKSPLTPFPKRGIILPFDKGRSWWIFKYM